PHRSAPPDQRRRLRLILIVSFTSLYTTPRSPLMSPRSFLRAAWLAPAAALMFTACFESPSDADDVGDADSVAVPTNYAFADSNGQSTVVYTGQTVRNLLIADIQAAARVAGAAGYT